MSNFNKLIILNGEPKDDIKSCKYDSNSKKHQIIFNNSNKPYLYAYRSVKWLDNPEIVNEDIYKFSNTNQVVFLILSRCICLETHILPTIAFSLLTEPIGAIIVKI